jgi:A/G-specific adenine glycosylase
MNSQAAKSLPETQALTFRTNLLAWYDENARPLPWRGTCDPYRIWLSEIMLQQTRVAAVIAHYHEFLHRFPTIAKLASAREASVLAAWSGLGYYRRARMLHAAAKLVAREYGGKFPATAKGLRDLPGIGRYTAAAIASIGFGEPVAVVDGNVERVLQRFSGRSLVGSDFWIVAGELLDRERPGDFNQAMMELGAIVCTPRAPACLTCPLVDLCATRGEMERPAKTARQKKREVHYALDCRDSQVFLVRRAPDARLMAGMWELPEIEEFLSATDRKLTSPSARSGKQNGDGRTRELKTPLFTVRHSITVTDYTVRVWRKTAPAGVRGQWVAADRLGRVALTGLARKILQKAELLAATGQAR